MLEIQFKQLGAEKWRRLGEDGNEFETPEEAWPEAQTAANLGLPWGGALFRLVEIGAGDHSDDCALGLGSENGCDCGAEPVVVEERRLFPAPGVTTRLVTDTRELDRLGLGTLVVEGVLEPKESE